MGGRDYPEDIGSAVVADDGRCGVCGSDGTGSDAAFVTDKNEAYETGRRDARGQVADALAEHAHYAFEAEKRLRHLAVVEQSVNGVVASVLEAAAEAEKKRGTEWAIVASRVRNPRPPERSR